MLTDTFEKLFKVSIKDSDIISLYCMSLLGYTWQCGMKYTDIKLQVHQENELILSLDKNIQGGISSVMGDNYVKSYEK